MHEAPPIRSRRPDDPGPSGLPIQAGESPRLLVRPTFAPALQLAEHLPLFVFVALWTAFFVGGAAHVLFQAFGNASLGWPVFLIAGLGAAVAAPPLVLRINATTYARTSYAFFDDHLVYREGPLGGQPRTVPLAIIAEIELIESRRQTRRGLGTIRLTSHPSASETGRSTPLCVRMFDVEAPKRLHSEIRALVEASRRDLPALAA